MESGVFGLFASGLAVAAVGSLFVAGDAALNALPAARLETLRTDSTTKATFQRYIDDPARVLSRWLVCRVVAIGLVGALFDEGALALGAASWSPLFAAIGAVVTYGTCAEVVGSIGRRRPESVGAWALRFLYPLEWLAIPLAEPLAILGRAVMRRLPEDLAESARVTETEVEWLVSRGERAGAIAGEPAEIIRNALDLGETTAREVMVPRRKVTALEAGTSLTDALEIVSREGHTRYPVFQGDIDHVVGVLNAKDLFRVIERGQLEGKVMGIVRGPPLFVTESQLVAPLLREMRAKRLHMAIVTDEFGGTSGVITLEDVIEEIVGEIRDEHDTEPQIEETPEGKVLADASVSLADLAAHLKQDLPTEGDFESLGGLLVHRAGRVPAVGATLQLDGLKFIVREADETRVVKVEIVRGEAPPTA